MSEILIDPQIDNRLAILQERESALQELRLKFFGLKIVGIEDKAGYKAVREARITLKNTRVQIEKDAKELRENAVKFQKMVIAREKELISIISDVESQLKQEEEFYNNLVEQEREKKEREEKARVQARVDQLAKFKYAHDLYDLQIMSDEDFEALLGHAEADFIKAQEIQKQEEARLAELKAEEERRRKEEEEKLARERAEFEKQKQEQERIDREFKAEQARIQAEYQEERRKLQEEQNKIAEEKRKLEEAKRLEQVRKETEERTRREEQERIAREQKEKEEAEKREQQRLARAEALKPDKEKIAAFGKMLLKITGPEVKDHMAQEVVRTAIDDLTKIGEFLIDKSQEL